MVSRLVLPAQVSFNQRQSIHKALDIFSAVRKASALEIDLHYDIVMLLDFAMVNEPVATSISTFGADMAWPFAPLRIIRGAVHRDTTRYFS